MNWEELRNLPPERIVAWAEAQAWAQAMASCAQDPQWHAEGDVWTHVKRVVEELTRLHEWPELTSHERTVLLFVALLHDVAKPLTSQTDPVTGRVTSPRHAVEGESVARGVLRGLQCDLATREEIARLVRYHGRPAFLLDRENPQYEVIRLSWLLSNRLLYLFALADTRGRDTDSMSRPEENLEYWKLVAEEVDCFNQPYPFANDHARFLFARQSAPDMFYVPHEQFSCRATLVCGLPGSGKDYWLARRRPELPVVSLDAIREEFNVSPTDDQGRVVQTAREFCRERLRSRRSFALSATNVVHATRARWIDLFADYRARTEIVYIEPPFERLLRQNSSREKPVPEHVVRKLADRCEPPTWLECHELLLDSG